jgi:ribosomal protein S27AE
MIKQPECPECEKLSNVADESNRIGNFLDWLSEKDIRLCSYEEDAEMYFPMSSGVENLLAEYFEIDLNKVEKERMALLEWLREQHENDKH